MNLTKKSLTLECLTLSMVVAVGWIVAPAMAQEKNVELEIVDQDGRRVDVRVLNQGEPQEGENDAQATRGKILIIDEDGQQREIDVSGAQSIVVNRSVSSIIQDGEEEKQVSGKAIIIGPDGQRQEYDLGGDLFGDDGVAKFQWAPLQGDLWGMPGKLRIQRFGGDSKFAIGVHCKAVDDTLRAHVDLEDGVGLVVTNEPVADSPAAKAGIQKHDILMYAEQTQLSSTSDLVAAVQAAGADQQPLSITLLRRGKEIGVNVTPVERKDLGDGVGGLFQPGFDFDVHLEEFGPGLIIGDDKDVMIEDLMKRMEDLDAQFQQRMDDFKLLRDELNHALEKRADDKQ